MHRYIAVLREILYQYTSVRYNAGKKRVLIEKRFYSSGDREETADRLAALVEGWSGVESGAGGARAGRGGRVRAEESMRAGRGSVVRGR